MNLRGGGATCNQAPSSILAESNVIKRHPEPKAKDLIKKQEDSSVASLLQNDVQGAGEFFGLCPQNDKVAREDSSGIRPQNDIKKDVILSQRRRIHLKRNWIFHSVQNARKKSKHAAFTMAEVLITLGIIGIVAAMTMPMLINKAQKMILAQQFKKMYTNIQNTINLIQADWGAPFECYNTSIGDYHLTECSVFWDKFLSKYQILQTCEREDYDCHPEYKSKAEVLAEGGEVINNHCTLDYPNGVFYILSDGSYIIVNTKISEIPIEHHAVFFLIDVNGAKGPNRWGYDLFYITLNRKDMKTDVIVANEVCAMKEKGGMYINEILLK